MSFTINADNLLVVSEQEIKEKCHRLYQSLDFDSNSNRYRNDRFLN